MEQGGDDTRPAVPHGMAPPGTTAVISAAASFSKKTKPAARVKTINGQTNNIITHALKKIMTKTAFET